MRSHGTSCALALLLAVAAGCQGGVSTLENDEGRYVVGLRGGRWVEWTDHERFDRAVAAYERSIRDYETLERRNARRLEYDAEKQESDWVGWTEEQRSTKRRVERNRRTDAWNVLHLMASEDEDLVLRLPPIPHGPR